MKYLGTVSPAGLAKISEHVQNMNKRAAKLGLEPLVLNVVDTRIVTFEHKDTGLKLRRTEHDVTLEGKIPSISGWSPIASIKFTENGNIVNVAPGVEISEYYFTAPNNCDHCKCARRRNDVIVLRHTDGREMVIGRNCVADFLRGEDAEGLIESLNWLANLPTILKDNDGEDYRERRGGRPVDDLINYLTATSVIVRKFGFMGRTKADEAGVTATTTLVSMLLHPWSAEDKKWIAKQGLVADAKDEETANKVVEWALTLESEQAPYLRNLCVIAKNGYVEADQQGYAASMITAYLRAQDQLRKAEEKKVEQQELTQIGEPGQRLRGLKVTCKRIRTTDSEFGVTTIIAFNLPGNVELTWFASGDQTRNWEEGEEYTIDCTVKGHHNDEKWGRSTRVNRVKDVA